MKKKMTREEFQAWWNAREARIQELRACADRIKAELEANRKSA